ncbi:MAG: SHOCT domain-containing protein [Desulfobulbaceae bacterium]|nr:SHOCT domain-containing protein [Desulfobulbaceae bacterium]
MGPENFFNSGMWIIPLIMIILCFILFKLKVFGRGGFRPPWQDSSESSDGKREPETALEILEKRYAKGEITKNEFEQMKSDLQA